MLNWVWHRTNIPTKAASPLEQVDPDDEVGEAQVDVAVLVLAGYEVASACPPFRADAGVRRRVVEGLGGAVTWRGARGEKRKEFVDDGLVVYFRGGGEKEG